MSLGYRVQSVGCREMRQKMLPNERWGRCHEETDGAALLSNAEIEEVFNSSFLIPHSSLQNTGGIL